MRLRVALGNRLLKGEIILAAATLLELVEWMINVRTLNCLVRRLQTKTLSHTQDKIFRVCWMKLNG